MEPNRGDTTVLVTSKGTEVPWAKLAPEVLGKLRELAGFDAAQWEQFQQYTEVVRVRAGECVVRETEPGDAMFLVLEGQLRARVIIGGKEIALSHLEPGRYFGEMALLDQGPRSADVVANEDSLLLKLSAASFGKLRAEAPDLALAILLSVSKLVVGRMRLLTKRYEDTLQFTRFGDYELLGEIARGGMGIVYKAKQVSLNRVVALKMILAGDQAGSKELKRFRKEVEAAAALQHPNIVTIHEVGEYEGRPFFSMDYVEGPNLSEVVRAGPLEVKRAARYVLKIASAIHQAHQQGILHRDLKPSNVLIDSRDEPQITDFGLAKRLQDQTDLTQSGETLGTPNYMPPERLSTKPEKAEPAGDIYSLGAILYHLITGRPPFRAESVNALLVQVMQSPPPRPQLLNSAVPKNLETICWKCLEKEPHHRYSSAAALAEDLGRFLQGERIVARPVIWPVRYWRRLRRKIGSN
jgi:CRP-like cAMP-binding protein